MVITLCITQDLFDERLPPDFNLYLSSILSYCSLPVRNGKTDRQNDIFPEFLMKI